MESALFVARGTNGGEEGVAIKGNTGILVIKELVS